MKTNNKIIEETLNSYILNEGLFSKKRNVNVTGWDDNSKSLYGYDEDTRESVFVKPKLDKRKVKYIVGVYGKKERKINVTNFYDGILFYGGDLNNKWYWAWDEKYVYYFYYDENNKEFLFQNGNPVDDVIQFIPKNILNQGQEQTQQSNQGNVGNVPSTNSNRQQGNPNQQQAQNTNQQQSNQGNVGNVPSTNSNRQQVSVNDVLNVNENYPLTNALLRLVRGGYIRDSRRIRNLMRDLSEINY